MLSAWTELLPLFVVRWLARRYCERVTTSHTDLPALVFATARPDTLVIVQRKEATDA